MFKKQINTYVEKTINWIKEKGHILFEHRPNIDFESALMEYVVMATRLKIYERIAEVYRALKVRVPNINKLNVLIRR